MILHSLALEAKGKAGCETDVKLVCCKLKMSVYEQMTCQPRSWASVHVSRSWSSQLQCPGDAEGSGCANRIKGVRAGAGFVGELGFPPCHCPREPLIKLTLTVGQ